MTQTPSRSGAKNFVQGRYLAVQPAGKQTAFVEYLPATLRKQVVRQVQRCPQGPLADRYPRQFLGFEEAHHTLFGLNELLNNRVGPGNDSMRGENDTQWMALEHSDQLENMLYMFRR